MKKEREISVISSCESKDGSTTCHLVGNELSDEHREYMEDVMQKLADFVSGLDYIYTKYGGQDDFVG